MKGGDTLKRFTEGLLFGAGFAISFTVVWYVAAYVIFPATVGPKIEKEANKQLSEYNSKVVPPEVRREMERPFHEMGPEESIAAASAIALAKYEPAPDGRMKAVVTEFLKKELDAKVPYDIGDEYSSGSYYPKENVSRGEALLLFSKTRRSQEQVPWPFITIALRAWAICRWSSSGRRSKSPAMARHADGSASVQKPGSEAGSAQAERRCNVHT